MENYKPRNLNKLFFKIITFFNKYVFLYYRSCGEEEEEENNDELESSNGEEESGASIHVKRLYFCFTHINNIMTFK